MGSPPSVGHADSEPPKRLRSDAASVDFVASARMGMSGLRYFSLGGRHFRGFLPAGMTSIGAPLTFVPLGSLMNPIPRLDEEREHKEQEK